jgi:hypothetical protein
VTLLRARDQSRALNLGSSRAAQPAASSRASAIDGDHPDPHKSRLGAESKYLAEQLSERRLVALARPRDRAVIGAWLAQITRVATSSAQRHSIRRDDRSPVA